MIRKKIIYQDLGLIDYKEAWDYQEELFIRIMDWKIVNRKDPLKGNQPAENFLLFCEHPHVFTLGKSGKEENILVDRSKLKNGEISFYKTNRGGDITYHGPGQVVGYPILDLEQFGLTIREYIHRLEEVIIRTLNQFGITGERLDGATGIWIDSDDPQKAKKICAIGVRASRYITMHGFALNVKTDLNYFSMINPCGFTDKGVVSMETVLGKAPGMDGVKNELKENFLDIFEAEWIKNGS
jgi:lipoyl(octanoyl) transferase